MARRVVQFAERGALAAAVADQTIGARQHLGVDLVLGRGIGAHRGDVQAGMEPVGDDQGRARGGRGDHDVGLEHEASTLVTGVTSMRRRLISSA